MLKYRRLTKNELNSFQKPFAEFLRKNHLSFADWQLLVKQNPVKARHLIEIFSDVVFHSILSNSPCLEKVSHNEFKTYRFLKSKVIVICARLKENAQMRFKNDNLNEILGKALLNDSLTVYKAEKEYEKDREPEMFAFLNDGCYPASEENFMLLADWID